MSTCPTCQEPLEDGARFCEACGKAVPGAEPAVLEGPLDDDGPISAPTKVNTLGATVAIKPVCTECGGTVGADHYCETCGTKAPTERDHFREVPATWVAGVCDRGLVHERNEDAMALFADAQLGRAAMVVCDGVTSSSDSDVASLAAARAAVAILRSPMPSGMGTKESREAAVRKAFEHAVEAAQNAVVANTAPDSTNPASCTFAAAVIEPGVLWYTGLGDSRVYYFPDGEPGMLLTTDDSMAQRFIEAGMPREQAENMPQAHAITKWLGRDSENIEPVVGELSVSGPGWVLVCSDGLWNYASDPAALAGRLAAAGTASPLDLALSLVEFAKAQGGRDNITAALARIGAPAGEQQ